MASSLTIRVRIAGVREKLRVFRDLPKDAQAALRDASAVIAAKLARSAKAAGTSTDAQSAAVARTVRVGRDRLPVVQAGGARRVTSTGARAFELLFGSEFGADGRFGWYAARKYDMSVGKQFWPHQGQQGRWFFPTVEREAPVIEREWHAAADEIVRRFEG